MSKGQKLKGAIEEACQKAAISMGEDLKKLSWFYRNTLKKEG